MSLETYLKYQLAVYCVAVSVALVLLGVVALGGAGYVYSNPPVEEIPSREVDAQEFSTNVETSAVVVNETVLYAEGETVSDQPVYFTDTMPVLRLGAVASVPDDRPVDVSHRLVVHQRATFQNEVFWEQREVLAEEEATVSDGTFRVNTTVNTSAVRERSATIRDVLGSIGSLSSELRLETTYATESTRDGVYEGQLSAASELSSNENGYWLEDPLSASQTESETVSGDVRQLSPNVPLAATLGLGGVVAFVLAGLVWFWGSRRADVYELEIQIERSRYSEWISEGELPMDHDKQFVYINTLTDLVDIAIDTNKRVIYDADVETYSVVDDDIIYYHAVDPRSVSSWLDL